MNKPMRVTVLLACGAAVAVILTSCSPPPSPTCVLAPPGPTDLGPATGLSTPPPEAVVFDLRYRAQTGAESDISYYSYWGYGGSSDEATADSFLEDVRKKSARYYYVQNPVFTGRKWAAVEYDRQQALALYFDLDADGKLGANERIPPTRKIDGGFDFITPDFLHTPKEGSPRLCRALLRVNFYRGSEPNCMWSPAAMMEGTATLNGQSARFLLFANGPGGGFDQHGSSSYSLLVGDQANLVAGRYVPRETLSSLISSEGQFYHLTIEGSRSNGLPARALLVKDTTPTGFLAVKLAGTNSVQATLTSLELHGVDDKTVFFRVGATKEKLSLPEGTYELTSGAASYGAANPRDWEVSFRQGPRAAVEPGKEIEVALGQPTLKVRAIEERNRYSQPAAESTSFKKGTQLYLEPKIVGKGQEVFSRFRQPTAGRSEKSDRPPEITITGPDGKQLLSKVMEYG